MAYEFWRENALACLKNAADAKAFCIEPRLPAGRQADALLPLAYQRFVREGTDGSSFSPVVSMHDCTLDDAGSAAHTPV